MAREPKERRGSKLHRTEIVTIRLDPKLRYLTELAARKQRRTVSSFIEWAIERTLSEVILHEDYNGDRPTTVSVREESARLWDVDEPDRLVRLATLYPDLLTHEEQVLWKLIQTCDALWNSEGEQQSRTRIPEQPQLDLDGLRMYWDAFKKVARGEDPESALPSSGSKETEKPKKKVIEAGKVEMPPMEPFEERIRASRVRR